MARLSVKEQRIKTEAAWDEFEKIKIIFAQKGENTFGSWDKFVQKINDREDVLQFGTAISPSTLKSPKTPDFIALKKEIDEFNKKVSEVEDVADNEIMARLNGSLAANYELTETIESLTKRVLSSKDIIDMLNRKIQMKDARINELLEQIEQLQLKVFK